MDPQISHRGPQLALPARPRLSMQTTTVASKPKLLQPRRHTTKHRLNTKSMEARATQSTTKKEATGIKKQRSRRTKQLGTKVDPMLLDSLLHKINWETILDNKIIKFNIKKRTTKKTFLVITNLVHSNHSKYNLHQ